MTKELWINLPVQDIKRSKDFFTGLGFSFNPKHETEDSACLIVGTKNVAVMLFSAPTFQGFTRNATADAHKVTEVLLSFDAESREEVDEIARKVEAAGGTVFGKPEEIQGWMYGCGFSDPDGHRWNALFMDVSKMPK